MYRLVELFYKYKRFFLFAFLELICFILIVKNNSYQSASYYSSSNTITASVMSVTTGITDYFSLASEMDQVAEENAQLRQQLEAYKLLITDKELEKLPAPDTNFVFTPAKIINNSIRRENNFITINRGENAGLRIGMGVVSANGVVGRVVSVSKRYATVMSLLHTDLRVSTQVKRSRILGSVNWDSENPELANFEYVPRHETILVNDTVVTSGFNSIFPEGINVGIVSETKLESHTAFHDIKIRFTNDFNALNYVYVVENKTKSERKQLEEQSNE